MFSLRQFVKVLIIEFIENGIGIQVHTVVLTIAYYGHFYSKKKPEITCKIDSVRLRTKL